MAAVARVFRGCRFLMSPAKKPVAAAAGAQATSRRSTARSRSRCRSPTRSAGSQAQTRSPAPAPSSSSGRTSRPRASRTQQTEERSSVMRVSKPYLATGTRLGCWRSPSSSALTSSRNE